MVDYSNLKQAIKEDHGLDVPESELEEIARTIPTGPIEDVVGARFRFEEWKGEPLGALVSEHDVRAHFGLSPNDKAYLGYVDGELVYFQYHVPFREGMEMLDGGNIHSTIAQHKARLVRELVDAQVSTEVIKKAVERRQ